MCQGECSLLELVHVEISLVKITKESVLTLNSLRLYMTEKLLSKLHSAASSSSALIRRQSLSLVMVALPPERALIFLLAYLEDDVSTPQYCHFQDWRKYCIIGSHIILKTLFKGKKKAFYYSKHSLKLRKRAKEEKDNPPRRKLFFPFSI